MDPKTLLLIAMGLAGGFIEPTRSTLCSAPEPEPEPGGGGEKPKFTQADLDKQIGERLGRASKDAEKKTADAVAAAIAKATEESNAKLAELEAKIADAGKSEAEKAKSERERAEKATRTQLETTAREKIAAEAKAKAAEDALFVEKQARRLDTFRGDLRKALVAGKAHAGTIEDAIDLFMLRGKVEFGEDGKPTIEGFGGTYTDAAAAAKAFLTASPAYVSHPGGGTGSQNSSPGFAGLKETDLHSGNVGRLLQSGAARLLGPAAMGLGPDEGERAAGA